jgi:hypothetical protein|tara:strand:- start:559 stop:1500 length:942 start_codon:yes stop_codon:yes gene_type:complete
MFTISTLRDLLRINHVIVNKKAIFFIIYVKSKHFRRLISLLITFFIVSCDTIKLNKEEVLARVGSAYLYRTDLRKNILNLINKEDSILKSRNFIDEWARTQILLKQAAFNLDEDKINTLNELVKQYEMDLFSNTYKKSIINESIDTIISTKDIDTFLLLNKSVFKLNGPLYQVRYIELPPENVDRDNIQHSFQRYNEEDRYFLDSLSFQYTHHLFSDSIWINKTDLLSEIKFLKQENLNRYIKKSQFFEIEDTMGVYLFFVNNYLKKGDIPPRDFIYPTIKNIILNQRKLKFEKEFEKDILQDAIKSKVYEIY